MLHKMAEITWTNRPIDLEMILQLLHAPEEETHIAPKLLKVPQAQEKEAMNSLSNNKAVQNLPWPSIQV